MTTETAPPTDNPNRAHGDHEIDHEMAQAAVARLKMGWGQRAVVVLLLTVVLVPPLAGFYSYFSGVPLHLLAARKDDKEADEESESSSISLVSGKAHTLDVSDEVAAALGIRKGGKDSTAVAQPPTAMRPLVLPGSTALDPTKLARIRARFAPARVVEIAQVRDPSREGGVTQFRELRQGDTVTRGQHLATFYSLDVGSKKNDLLDALVQLELDQKELDAAELHSGAVPEVFLLTLKRAVEGDRNNINRAINSLRLWEIPQEEIDALHAEAAKISAGKSAWFKTPEGKWVKTAEEPKNNKPDAANGAKVDVANGVKVDAPNGEKHDAPNGERHDAPNGAKVDLGKAVGNEGDWGKVTMRSPFDGVVVERNLHEGEMVVDNTVNLLQIADVSKLLVIANCPEDSLPTLEALNHSERRWTVQTVGTGSAKGLPGTIDEIGYIIDPNQHTAIIKGYVENPGKHIRAGQYVTATVNIPPPADVVEIPVDALVDDGKQSLLFIQPDAAKHQFTMRRVQVTHRFDRTVFVQDTPIPEAERLTASEAEEGLLPKEPLRPGERVLLAGSVELKRVVLDLESRPKDKASDLLVKAKARPLVDHGSSPEPKQRSRKS
jgi:cobalt-zinc-cadmium efflux system membrane fusion protein